MAYTLLKKLTGSSKSKPYQYLEDEVRSPIKEQRDFQLEFVRDVFTVPGFSAAKYLENEFARLAAMNEHTSKQIRSRLEKCSHKTSHSLKLIVEDNYPDFISCFGQIRDIHSFLSLKIATVDQLLQRFRTVLKYQNSIEFNADYSRWQAALEYCSRRKSSKHGAGSADTTHIYDEHGNIIIAGNEFVDSPSQLVDDIAAMCDEKKWLEAIHILNALTQDLYRGEYEYLRKRTRKQIKLKVIGFRRYIFRELCKMLLINALNKSYRTRLTVYILKIQKERYFNNGITLYLQCKTKELRHATHHVHHQYELNNSGDSSKTFVIDLTLMIFNFIRQLLNEYESILVQSSAKCKYHDAMSYLIVYISTTVLSMYTTQLKVQVFQAMTCDISLRSIGESLRIAYGHMNKLKFYGLSLEMYLNQYLLETVREYIDLFFDDQSNDIQHSVNSDSFVLKEIKLSTALALSASADMHSNDTGTADSATSGSVRTSGGSARGSSGSGGDGGVGGCAMTAQAIKALQKHSLSKKRKSFNRYASVVTDVQFESYRSMDRARQQRTIYVSTSTQRIYDEMKKIMNESRALLSFSYYPIMTKQMISFFIENIVKYLQSYCSNLTCILREYKQYALTDMQCMALICNVYYIGNDLLQRIDNRLLRTCKCRKIERMQSFKEKLAILCSEQVRYFGKSVAHKWLVNVLQFGENVTMTKLYNGHVQAANEQGEASLAATPRWTDFVAKLLEMKQLCVKYFDADIQGTLISAIVRSTIKSIYNHSHCWNHAHYQGEETIGQHTVQQFIFDIKCFAFVVDSYMDDGCKDVANGIVQKAMSLNMDCDSIPPSNEWYLAQIKQYIASNEHLVV